MVRPDPAKSWDWVLKLVSGKDLPACHLFQPAHEAEVAPGVKAQTWGRKTRH